MTEPEPEPELRRALELALGEPAPPYGLQGRVRRALDERLVAASSTRARAWLGFVAFAALALGVLLGVRIKPRAHDTAVKGSVLALRSARAILRPDTELVVDRDDERGSSLRLVSGTVLIHVQKGTGRSFEVIAGATRVKVVGTIFGVSRHANEAVAVEVIEGVVRVGDASGERRLGAGERWPAGAALFDDSSELALLRATISVAPSATAREPEAAATDSEVQRAEPAASGSPHTSTAMLPAAQAEPSASTTKAVGVAADAEAQRAYADAKSLERSGDRDAALAAYEALSVRGGGVAEDALFSVLRLRAAQNERAAAQAAIARYRARFPAGRYARDVDVHALNLDTANGDEPSALRECEAFLAQFPDDPRAWRFRLVRAGERASRGDCPNALMDLTSVPASEAKQSVVTLCAKP